MECGDTIALAPTGPQQGLWDIMGGRRDIVDMGEVTGNSSDLSREREVSEYCRSPTSPHLCDVLLNVRF